MSRTRGADATGMVAVPGGAFTMGSERFYPEERPCHAVAVGALWMDARPVTNAQFATFVAETGYVTTAERPPDPVELPGVDPELLVPGGVVFSLTDGPVPLDDWSRWWAYVPGAQWRAPRGPGSDIAGCDDHPVVQVSAEDVAAYVNWRGVRLPTEAEWEHAARGGIEGADYCWGDEPFPDGTRLAHTWEGRFPWEPAREEADRWTAPVGSYPPNGYGLFDMAGNVWEWTSSQWSEAHPAVSPCCGRTETGDLPREEHDVEAEPMRVIKGGSHLCAPEYCLRFRPAARQPQSVDTSTSHIGFRCVSEGDSFASGQANG